MNQYKIAFLAWATCQTITGVLYSKICLPSENVGLINCPMPSTEQPNSPWDYRTRIDKRDLVESRHFTPKVEQLIRGESTSSIVADIAYTLDHFPNHHRALASLVRYSERTKKTTFPSLKYSVECYLKRAAHFKEDDLVVRVIYSSYLTKHSKNSEAIIQIQHIESQENKSTLIKYNLGLLYFNLNDYDKSLSYAHQAYAEDFPLPGLKNKLLSVKKWKELLPPKKSNAEDDQTSVMEDISSEQNDSKSQEEPKKP
jgi:hypothetical protein